MTWFLAPGNRNTVPTGIAVVLMATALVACSPASDSLQNLSPPETRRDSTVDTIHGVDIPDPYRWLEAQDAPEVRRWIDAQNEYSEQVIGETAARDRLRQRFGDLLNVNEVGVPRKAGDHEYFTLRRKGEELAAIYRRESPSQPARIDPDGDYELIVSPVGMSDDNTTSIGIQSVSPDGSLLMYRVRNGGQDEVELRILNLETGDELPERLPWSLYGSAFFSQDGKGFYYTPRSRQSGPRVYYHNLGSDMADDVLLFGEGYGPRSFIQTSEIADGRYLLFTVHHGWARSELHIKDMTKDEQPRVLAMDVDGRFNARYIDGRLLVLTNLDAPNNRLAEIDLEAPEPANWRDVVAEADSVIQDYSFIDGKLYLTYLRNVSSEIRVFELDGTPAGEVVTPDAHAASIREVGAGKALLTLTSFAQPPVSYLLDLESGERQLWAEQEVPYSPEGVEVKQVWYPSKDGTSVPMYIVHRKGLELTGDTPTLLYGYGGFNAFTTPRFRAMGGVWIENGGVFAVANLRGGGEFGETWHRAGMLGNKQNVFNDFIAAAEWLIANDYTRPDRLAIWGSSNGGLLVGSAVTQRPDLYGAVLCTLPDLDMVRFNTFTETNNMPALLEYGDAGIPEQFEFLRKYSPYQAVVPETDYPAVMIVQGDLDTRVSPLQARKMAARLQAATVSDRPVILRYHPKVGHGAPMPISRRVEDRAAEMAFLAQQLGLEL